MPELLGLFGAQLSPLGASNWGDRTGHVRLRFDRFRLGSRVRRGPRRHRGSHHRGMVVICGCLDFSRPWLRTRVMATVALGRGSG